MRRTRHFVIRNGSFHAQRAPKQIPMYYMGLPKRHPSWTTSVETVGVTLILFRVHLMIGLATAQVRIILVSEPRELLLNKGRLHGPECVLPMFVADTWPVIGSRPHMNRMIRKVLGIPTCRGPRSPTVGIHKAQRSLELQIAQSRPYSYSLGPKVGIIYIHGAPGEDQH